MSMYMLAEGRLPEGTQCPNGTLAVMAHLAPRRTEWQRLEIKSRGRQWVSSRRNGDMPIKTRQAGSATIACVPALGGRALWNIRMMYQIRRGSLWPRAEGGSREGGD